MKLKRVLFGIFSLAPIVGVVALAACGTKAPDGSRENPFVVKSMEQAKVECGVQGHRPHLGYKNYEDFLADWKKMDGFSRTETPEQVFELKNTAPTDAFPVPGSSGIFQCVSFIPNPSSVAYKYPYNYFYKVA